jgi:hypothetical protein
LILHDPTPSERFELNNAFGTLSVATKWGMRPTLHAVAPATVEEETAFIEPLREHLEEMAKFFGLKSTGGKAA